MSPMHMSDYYELQVQLTNQILLPNEKKNYFIDSYIFSY